MADQHEKYAEEQLKNLARRLREVRKAKGYSNYENFAFEHDINRAQYGRYEKGANISFLTLGKLVHALGMTMEEFFSEGFD